MDRYSRSHLAPATLFVNARQHAGREIASMADLLADLAEIDANKHYVPAGYESMKAYCLAELPYTVDEARNRIRAARVAREFPTILPMLADGRLLLMTVLHLAPRLTHENADELLAQAARKTRPELETLLAERFPRAEVFSWTEQPLNDCEKNHECVPERVELAAKTGPMPRTVTVTPLSAQTYGVQFPMTRDEYDLVRRSRELKPAADDKEVFIRALRAHVARMEKRKYGASEGPVRVPRMTTNSRHIPAHVRRAVRKRDGDRCAFVSENGHRCEARTHLQFDHIVPVGRGGEATVSNTRLLCRTHNQYEAERLYGAEFMENKRKTAAETRVAKKERATALKKANAELDRDIIAGLRNLGFTAANARQAAESTRHLADAPLEERFRAALSRPRPREAHLVRPAPAPTAARCTP